MKKILLLLLTSFVTLSLFAQRPEATLFLKDGTSQKGFAYINGRKIKFKETRKGKRQVLDHSTVSKVILYKKGTSKEYVYKKVFNKDVYLLLRVLIKGKVYLFLEEKNGGASFDASGNFSVNTYSNNGIYFIGKNKENIVSNAGIGSLYSKGFNGKIASKYFKDCPALLEKINNKEFKTYDLKGAVNYYNNDCK